MSRKVWLIGLTLGLLLSVVGTTAWSGAVLHIGNPPHSGTYLFGDEVQPILNNQLQILENGNGNPDLNTLYLILGIPNDTSQTFAVTANSSISATWKGQLGPGGEAYSAAGFSPSGNSSNNFTNWAAADLAVNGITAGTFGLYAYTFTGSPFITGGDTVTVNFSGPIPDGTFAVAWAQATNSPTRTFSTPFTESGLVPEPSTLLLLGSGLIGLAGFGRKKFKK